MPGEQLEMHVKSTTAIAVIRSKQRGRMDGWMERCLGFGLVLVLVFGFGLHLTRVRIESKTKK